MDCRHAAAGFISAEAKRDGGYRRKMVFAIEKIRRFPGAHGNANNSAGGDYERNDNQDFPANRYRSALYVLCLSRWRGYAASLTKGRRRNQQDEEET